NRNVGRRRHPGARTTACRHQRHRCGRRARRRRVRAAARALPVPTGVGRRTGHLDRERLHCHGELPAAGDDLSPPGAAMTIDYNTAAIDAAAATSRWAALVKLDVDVDVVGTWDRGLPRNKRILVPIDVQAMVVPDASAESTVPLAGMRDDPAPFADGAARAAGVQLHWAMPDALLRGKRTEDTSALALPPLPDRWVGIRTLLPEGGRLVHVRGWVVDAANGSVTPLAEYSGSTNDAPDGTPTFDPLDGSSGGTLLWSATYE